MSRITIQKWRTFAEHPPANGPVRPWTFIPLLYFMQALPVTLVQDVTTLVYKDLGVGNESITRWTSLIALPWALQMLFGPLVDLTSTKRNWTLRGQLLIGSCLAVMPFVLQLPHAFELSLGVLFVAAIFSTLCNVATDGFYLLVLPKEAQAGFAGVQTTSYRLGTLFGKGILAIVAGWFISHGHLTPALSWGLAFGFGAIVYLSGWMVNRRLIPRPETDVAKVELAQTTRNGPIQQTMSVLGLGLSAYFSCAALVRLAAHGAWRVFDAGLTGKLKGWRLSDDPRALGISLGIGGVGAEMGQLAFAALLLAVSLTVARRKIIGTEMGNAFLSYFQQAKILPILAFLMFYRFGEAMVVKISPLFLKDAASSGGLGLTTETVGQIKGVFGVFGIVLGGLFGGYIVSKFGLRRSFWPIAILMHLPNFLYLWASIARPPVTFMFGVDFAEQFGYGFGFAGYMIFQMTVARRGNFPTSHYAIGVGIGALFISVAGVTSGILQTNLGYTGFFTAALFCTIPGLLTLFFVPLDEPNAR